MTNSFDAEKRMSVFMKLKIRTHKKFLVGSENKNVDFIQNVNTTYIREFSSFNYLQNYVKSAYKSTVSLNIMHNYPIKGVTSLANIYLIPTIRNRGVGSHIISMINETADHANHIVVLEPALNEEGRITYSGLNEEEIVVAKQYRDNLVAFYTKLGYTPLSDHVDNMNPELYASLKHGGSMIRLPRNVLPKNFRK